MAIQLTCPGCRQMLAIPLENRGALVRCPACDTTFSSDTARIEPPAPVQVPPSPLLGPGYQEVPIRSEEADRTPRPRDVEERWEDDPLARRPKPNPAPVLFVFGGLVLALIVILLVSAFLWPGFLLQGSGSHDLLSLAPADSVALVGVSVSKMPDKLAELKKELGDKAILVEVLADSEKMLFSANLVKDKASFFGAVLTKSPYDRQKLKQQLNLVPGRTVNGTSIYTLTIDQNRKEAVLIAMPNSRVLVAGMMPVDDFARCVGNQGRSPVVSADLLQRARQLESSELWTVVANDGIVKEFLDGQQPIAVMLLAQLGGAGPAGELIAGALPLLQKCKTFSLCNRLVDKDHRMEISVEFRNAADASELHKFVDENVRPALARLAVKNIVAGAGADEMTQLIQDLQRTFAVEQSGTIVTASGVISEAIWKEVAEKALNNQGPKLR